MIAVTAATGKLGRLVMEALLSKVDARQVVAAVRSPEKAQALAARGVQVRRADYDRPETLEPALAGVQKLLLISGSEVGQRARQHRAVIEAAQRARVQLVAYTSILHCDRSHISLAAEHLATEETLRGSGLPYVLLRNGWYLENYTENLGPALQHGALIGCAGAGRIAAAARADYAAAAAAVLSGEGHTNQSYELAGDHPFSMAELAAEVSRQSGKSIAYRDLPPAELEQTLKGMGLPAPVAAMLANVDVNIARGELDDRSGTLHRLIARETTPLSAAVREGLKAVAAREAR